MAFKKTISLLFLTVLLLQVLPVKQIGYVLYSNQITEEIQHEKDTSKKPSCEEDNVLWPIENNNCLNKNSSLTQIESYCLKLPLNYAEDIQIPPPDRA